MENEVQQLNKGGQCWLELATIRGKQGLELTVKAVPEVEAFMKSLGNGQQHSTTLFSRNWYNLEPERELFVYHLQRELDGDSYVLGKVCDVLKNADDTQINLSFLRLVGISQPQGVRFGIVGPYSRPFIKKIGEEILSETRKLILDYIVPVHINLRLTSTVL